MTSAYITFLTGKSYLPGVVTLGYKLRELETSHDLVVLADTDTLSEEQVELLGAIFDKVVSVNDAVISAPLAPLQAALGREELAVTYTKILLWNQPYDTVVYMDADTLPLRSLDSLFDTEFESDQVLASPDAGWPDIFNTGVLVLKPNKSTFGELIDFAKSATSFDGADQGLFNEYFNIKTNGRNWVRLPFLFNVTPNYSHAYQYLPAFNRFFPQINVLHFIGQFKPWHSQSILQADTTNFHHLWWADFNKFVNPLLRAKLLSVPQGEASNLHFAKLHNVWDVANTSAPSYASLQPEPPIAPVFPWERRSTQVEPTRVFDVPSGSGSIGQSKLDDTLSQNIEKLQLKTKSTRNSFTEESSFNPTKALDEVAKIPLQFLSKQKQEEK